MGRYLRCKELSENNLKDACERGDLPLIAECLTAYPEWLFSYVVDAAPVYYYYLGHTVIHDQFDAFVLLIEFGADPSLRRWQAARFAVQHKRLQLVQWFVEEGKIGVELLSDLLLEAARSGDCAIIRYLVSNGAVVNERVLVWAAGAGQLDATKLVADLGVDLRTWDDMILRSCASSNKIELVKWLVKDVGMDVNTFWPVSRRWPEPSESTALASAVKYGYKDVAEYLLAEGAKGPSAKDTFPPGYYTPVPTSMGQHSIEKWINDLKEHNETQVTEAVIALQEIGKYCFEAVAELLQHPVGKWHAIPLLMRLSPARAIPSLLDIVNRDRENSVRFKEHSKKYIRIKAINALGRVCVRDNSELESLYTEYQVADALGYFIDPAHPHKHDEVIFAVKKALAVIDTDRARNILQGIL